MKHSGSAVLQALVEITAQALRESVEATSRSEHALVLDPALEPACSAARVAAHLDCGGSAKSVAAILGRLCDAGLADRGPRARRLKSGRLKTYSGSYVYSPTERGRQVDALVASRTAARGGVFAPLSSLGLSTREMLALR